MAASGAVARAGRNGADGPGRPFETTTEIVNGQQHEVFVNRKRSLREALAAGVASSADLVHVATDAAEFTFADVGRDVASMAAALREQYGVGPGDRVAIASANGYEYLVTFWATVSLDAVVVALNGWWTEPEMRYAIELTEPTVLFGDERRLARLGAVEGLPTPRTRTCSRSSSRTAGRRAARHADRRGRPVPGAVHERHHRAVEGGDAVAPQQPALGAVGDAARRGPRSPSATPAPPPGGRWRSVGPMFHVGGLNCQLIPAMLTGGKIVYPAPGRWSEERHLELTEQHGATQWSLVCRPRLAARRLPSAARLRPVDGLDGRRRQRVLAAGADRPPEAGAAPGPARRRLRDERDQRRRHEPRWRRR